MDTEELLQICHGDPGQTRHFGRPKCADRHTDGGRNMGFGEQWNSKRT